MPSRPSTRPSDARGRRSFAFALEDSRMRAATLRGGLSQSLLDTERTVPVRLAQPSSARRQTRAANDPASAEQRNEGRTCDRERGRRKGNEQADAADDPIPREERRADPLLLRERERGVVR